MSRVPFRAGQIASEKTVLSLLRVKLSELVFAATRTLSGHSPPLPGALAGVQRGKASGPTSARLRYAQNHPNLACDTGML